jgi:hypothetical protein
MAEPAAAPEPAMPEQQEVPKPAETPEPAPPETPEPASPAETPVEQPEAEGSAPEVDPEPGSPRRKRPREPARPLVPRLDANFWQQLIHESRATREASRRERFTNLLRF